MDWRITRFPILASTNDLALEWMRTGRATAGDVLLADEQVAGRGRPGRTWHSSRGALLCTAVLPFHVERVGWSALAAGIAVARAVRELGAPAGVKWPNDVVLDGGKLAGILVETSVPELCAVGIGLNVTNPLPENVRTPARRLAETLPEATVEATLETVLRHLSQTWQQLLAPDFAPLRAAWAALDTTAGRHVHWSTHDIQGLAEGVAGDGSLLIRTPNGRQVAANVGEVNFLG